MKKNVWHLFENLNVCSFTTKSCTILWHHWCLLWVTTRVLSGQMHNLRIHIYGMHLQVGLPTAINEKKRKLKCACVTSENQWRHVLARHSHTFSILMHTFFYCLFLSSVRLSDFVAMGCDLLRTWLTDWHSDTVSFMLSNLKSTFFSFGCNYSADCTYKIQ